MLAEIHEKDASGDIARIYAEVRHLWGVPYVSAIHRHLATRPGVLPWAWEAVAPVFRSGRAQRAAWACAEGLDVTPLDAIAADVLAVWGLDAQATTAARAAAESFVRVAPVNMVFAALVKALLAGETGQGAADAGGWQPPAALPAALGMVGTAEAGADLRSVLSRFATPTDAAPFVPGLYRMLANWPALLGHLAVVLAPRLAGAQVAAACDLVRARIDACVPDVLAALPAAAGATGRPDEAERAHFLTVGATYRKTSPELIVVGGLIRDALP